MAESSEPLMLFESSGLDINENMPNSENCSFSKVEPSIETTSSLVCTENDSNFTESFNSYENSGVCIKSLENCPEMPSINFDESLMNRDECTSTENVDSGIHDSENNILDSAILKFDASEQIFSENCGVMISNFIHDEDESEFKDEEFHDAAQFFKDPSSLVFLENAGSSNAPVDSLMARSSLYQKFDPLHAKFFSQTNINSNELQEISENEIEPELGSLGVALSSEAKTDKHQNSADAALLEVASDELPNIISPETPANDAVPDIVNKHLCNVSPRESLGNILISFDSPLINKDAVSEFESEKAPEKMYTEEELLQALKVKELTVQETFLKKQQELEEHFLKRQQELEAKIGQQQCLSSTLNAVVKEFVDIVSDLSDKESLLKEKLKIAERENVKLEEDLKTSVEDIQRVETAFSDFHKRYEQCKGLLKVSAENEKSLQQSLDAANLQLREKEEMYHALQSRTEEMLDKANIEVANAKKAGDGQIAVLKAQLKKAELKISSLESDVKHVKIENGKLSNICDELMAKVSES